MTESAAASLLPPRRTLLLCGPDAWTTQQCEGLSGQNGLAVGLSLPGFTSLAARQVHRVLGQSFDTLVLDWRSGWNTNHLSAVSGTLRAGGVLIILLAEPDVWDERYAWTDTADTSPSRLFPFWLDQMRHHGAHWHTPDNPPLPVDLLPTASDQPLPVDPQALAEQQAVVDAIVGLPQAHQHHMLLTAGRGHGKSMALALAALQCAETLDVVLLGPLAAHVDLLRGYIDQLMPRFADSDADKEQRRARLTLCTWDTLPTEWPQDALLLVDEAAMFGLPRLRQLAKQARWRVFATTTDGYEGSGQGFRLRFLPWLRRQRGGTLVCQLNHPMRWSANDPVAQQLHASLMQTQRWPELSASALTPLRIEPLSASQLLDDADLRAQWVALLTAAHYQTRPDDVRQALDDPSVQQRALWCGDQLAGLCLTLDEPPLSPELTDAVWRGARRPAGQQAKQSMVGQLGCHAAGQWHGVRIWRLVVHPDAVRQGWGRQLVADVIKTATEAGYDYVATSYGMTEELLQFWHCAFVDSADSARWHLVRIGQQEDAASGARSALSVYPLQPSVAAWASTAEHTLAAWLPEQHEYNTAFNDDLLWSLLRALPPPKLPAFEQQRIRHWCASQQPVSALRPALARAFWAAAQQSELPGWPTDERLAAIYLLWHGASWDTLQQHSGCANQKALLARLRTLFADL
ncbi:MAG: tRNA(Met) cytidine acetyltransferase [Natronospirillum sp.]